MCVFGVVWGTGEHWTDLRGGVPVPGPLHQNTSSHSTQDTGLLVRREQVEPEHGIKLS